LSNKRTNNTVMTTTEIIKSLLQGRTTEQLIADAKEARKNKSEESNRMICALAMDVLSDRMNLDDFEALYNELYEQH
jgi:hypothetical protein